MCVFFVRLLTRTKVPSEQGHDGLFTVSPHARKSQLHRRSVNRAEGSAGVCLYKDVGPIDTVTATVEQPHSLWSKWGTVAPVVRERVCLFPPPTTQPPASARSACCPAARCTSAEAQLCPHADAPYSSALSVLPLLKAGVLNCSQITHACKSDKLWSFPEKQNHTYTHKTVFPHSRSPLLPHR